MRSAPVILLVAVLVLSTACSPLPANEPVAEGAWANPPVLAANWLTDNIIGNRSRMIQVTFIAFAVGILILVTSTRKH